MNRQTLSRKVADYLTLCRAGDDEAAGRVFRELYAGLFEALVQDLLARGADYEDAREIANSVIVKSMVDCTRFDRDRSTGMAWLRRQARNAWIDRLRKRHRRPRVAIWPDDPDDRGSHGDTVCDEVLADPHDAFDEVDQRLDAAWLLARLQARLPQVLSAKTLRIAQALLHHDGDIRRTSRRCQVTEERVRQVARRLRALVIDLMQPEPYSA